MHRNAVLTLIMLLVACASPKDEYYAGSTASRLNIDPFPGKEKWVDIAKMFTKQSVKGADPAILWNVGMYNKGGVSYSFPYNNYTLKDLSFTNVDFNSEYFKFFDKKKVAVFLSIEPGYTDIEAAINIVMSKYSEYDSIKGVCIDLEWYDNEFPIKRSSIIRWVTVLESYGDNFQLVLKHWNVNNIEATNSKKVIYLQDMESVKDMDEFVKRHKLWFRTYYPSNIGVLLGFSSDTDFYNKFETPTKEIYNTIYNETNINVSYFWSDSTVLDYIK